MEMSISCTPVSQPYHTAIKSHEKYGEYLNYLTSCSSQLVTGCNFDVWLHQFEDKSGFVIFQHVSGLWGWRLSDFKGKTVTFKSAIFKTEDESMRDSIQYANDNSIFWSKAYGH